MAHFLDCFIYTIKVSAGISGIKKSILGTGRETPSKRHTNKNSIANSRFHSQGSRDSDCDMLFDVLPLNEMKNVIDLLSLYNDVNTKVIEDK